MEEPPCIGVFAFLGEMGLGPARVFANSGLALSRLLPGPGAWPGLSGYVRQALIIFLKVPMYVNLGPRFRTVGAEVASVVKIEHHYTAFL
jgi:hypothetical protein